MFTCSMSLAVQVALDFLGACRDYHSFVASGRADYFRLGELRGRMDAWESALFLFCSSSRLSLHDVLAVARSYNRYMNRPRVWKVS